MFKLCWSVLALVFPALWYYWKRSMARGKSKVNNLKEIKSRKVYSCSICRTPITHYEQLMSKAFHGRSGRAYLFNSACNITLGSREERMLLTGLHAVCDVHCRTCKEVVGWM